MMLMTASWLKCLRWGKNRNMVIYILNKTPGNKNWQRDYNDHVIRDIEEYKRIKFHIKNNPANWKDDTFYNK